MIALAAVRLRSMAGETPAAITPSQPPFPKHFKPRQF
jgi:hypothetical protein